MAMYYIGIDPGKETGLAVWDGTRKQFRTVQTCTIVHALEFCFKLWEMERPGEIELYVEDARQRSWLPREKSISEYRGKLMGAGSVKRDCTIWQEFSEEYGIPLHLVPPRPGMTKWSPEYFKTITGWTGRTSEHARDAALLVFQR